MTLLMLLSALLSALSGGQARALTPRASVAVAQVATRAVSAQAVRGPRAGRPVPATPVLASIAAAPARPDWRLAAIEPTFASRRRE